MNSTAAALQVIPRLPHFRDPAGSGDPLPDDIIGARIVNMGSSPPAAGVEGGGLVIDYIPQGQPVVRRARLPRSE